MAATAAVRVLDDVRRRLAALEVTGGRGEVVDLGTVDLAAPTTVTLSLAEEIEQASGGLPLP